MPGLNSAVRLCRSSVKNLMKPSGISEASAPMVGKSLPGRLKLTANGFGSILRMRTSSTSPGSAPLTKIGPVTECGPPPGFAFRSSTTCSIVMPGCTLSCECIIVSIETVSPELTVSLGGSFGSSQPHCTVSSVAGSVWCLPAGAFGAQSWLPLGAADCCAMTAPPARAATTAATIKVRFVEIMGASSLVGHSDSEARQDRSSSFRHDRSPPKTAHAPSISHMRYSGKI